MSRPFAFSVATPTAPSGNTLVIEGYDPQRQQLVWQGDGEASMGDALCTSGRYSGFNPCHSTGTSCIGTRCATSSYAGCYACDYG